MLYRVFVPHPRDGVMVWQGRRTDSLPRAIERAQSVNAARHFSEAEVRDMQTNRTLWRAGIFFNGQACEQLRAVANRATMRGLMAGILDELRRID